MKHLFVSYELAKLAKEKGFNEPCIAHYLNRLLQYKYCVENSNTSLPKDGHNEFIAVPLYQQLVDWFREKYGIQVYERTIPAGTSDRSAKYLVKRIGQLTETEPLSLTAALTKAFELI